MIHNNNIVIDYINMFVSKDWKLKVKYLFRKNFKQFLKLLQANKLIEKSHLRKSKYDEEYEKFEEKEDNDAEDIGLKLKKNCDFYLKKAQQKVDFLQDEAEEPDMSQHNLGDDFRKGSNNFLA